jgi:glucokinase
MPEDASSVNGLGIGAPGPIDTARGVVVLLPNIPGWENFPLQQLLTDRLHLPVEIANDANMAALGENHFGAARGAKNMLYFTISTGIGSGIICDGRILLGEHGLAAELGHLTVMPDGPLCGCGKRGHLEAVASGPSLARRARERLSEGGASLLIDWTQGEISKVTADLVSKAAAEADPTACAIMKETGWYIGSAIANMLVVFNPSIIVIGGGVSNAGELLLAPIRESINALAMNASYTRDLQVVRSMLGDDSGLYGAFALSRGAGR